MAIHRSKLTSLADGVTMAAPSPHVRLVWHHNGGQEKTIGYLGFTDPQLAERCYSFLRERAGRYNRQQDSGVCKPRKAERVDGAALELKWHRPNAELLHQFISKDLLHTQA